jgi:hypothetical protein
VKPRIRQRLDQEKGKISRRLEPFIGGTSPRVEGQPEISAPRPTYEFAERSQGISYGGVPAVLALAKQVGLMATIDAQLNILQRARPYCDSDHVLNIALNLLCGGHVLEDIELRRKDAAFLDAIGARAIPDPTTAGDFCRRFEEADVWRLMEIVNEVRLEVWRSSSPHLTKETARIDVDGTAVTTTGECKEGMDVSYKGEWGYHPLLVSLANTGEPLFIVNRPGNRPSHEGAPAVLDKAIELCRRAGFADILLRGDTDFTMTTHLDRWDADGIRFVLGYDASPPFVERAEKVPPNDYDELVRKAHAAFSNKSKKSRGKQPRVKEEIVRRRGFLNKRLLAEDTAEFEFKPRRAQKTYRIVVLRKLIQEDRGQLCVGLDFKYFFYVTNDRSLTQAEVIREANGRCEQEKLIGQLKSGTRALHAPVNTLNANWAYMVMASLAWTLKAWVALLLPVTPRWRDQHISEKTRILRMSFKTFLQSLILIPAQIIRHSRQLIVRLLSWRPELPVLFRLMDAL